MRQQDKTISILLTLLCSVQGEGGLVLVQSDA